MNIVHLMASPFFGGPERQMLGLALHLPAQSRFVSFPENGAAKAFLDRARAQGIPSEALTNNFPHVFAAVRELSQKLITWKTDLLTTSGYKPDILGLWAARKAGIPVVSISHGWTGATWKVRLYENLDRRLLRKFDAVVCVSDAQRHKVLKTGVTLDKAVLIHNAVAESAFADADPKYLAPLQKLFPRPMPLVVGAAGRLSPEKGFEVLIDAAQKVCKARTDVGFVIFGDGPLREALKQRIRDRVLEERFILAGFRDDVASFLPHLSLGVMSSYTEGLPMALLETCAAGVPTVATAVGGIPEVITDNVDGWLAPSGEPEKLADRLLEALSDPDRRRRFGERARIKVRSDFSFTGSARLFMEMVERLPSSRLPSAPRAKVCEHS